MKLPSITDTVDHCMKSNFLYADQSIHHHKDIYIYAHQLEFWTVFTQHSLEQVYRERLLTGPSF